jgi:hypothetical protein
MTLSILFLLTTNAEDNAQKKDHTATQNGFFFLQAVYGQINIKKRMIFLKITKPCHICSSPPNPL